MPAEPYITVNVSDALARIEAKVDNINTQMVAKADVASVHLIESRLGVLETKQAVTEGIADASAKARGRLWIAMSALTGVVAAAATTFGIVLSHLHH